MKKILIYILIGVIITLSVLAGIMRWLNNRPDVRFGDQRAAVITQTQALSRFESASYSIDKIIEASTNYTGLKQYLFGDKILLVAHGTVIAGYDLSTMTPDNFSGSGSEIVIKLPEPQIFSVIIDNEQTRVFDRDRGIFTKGQINLESQARQEAETAIRQAACEGGILNLASENAKKQLEVLFKSAGFTSVAITSSVPACK